MLASVQVRVVFHTWTQVPGAQPNNKESRLTPSQSQTKRQLRVTRPDQHLKDQSIEPDSIHE